MAGELEWFGDEVVAKVLNAACDGLYEGAELILGEANKLVPVDTGTLRRSGEASVNRPSLEAAISYDTPYAVRLHENPQYHFQDKKNPDAQGKWLEKALVDHADDALDAAGKVMRDRLGGI